MVADIHRERDDFLCVMRRENQVISDGENEIRYTTALKKYEELEEYDD